MEVTDEQRAAVASLPSLAQRVVMERIADVEASDVECYRRAKGGAKSDSAARNSVHKILTNANTVKVLNMFNTDQPLNNAIMSREELLEDLTNVARVSVADVMSWTTCVGSLLDTQTGDESSYPSIITVKNMNEVEPWVLKCVKSVEQTKSGMIKLTLEDRTAARKLLIDMQGYNAPIKTINAEITAENVDDNEFLEGLESFGLK